MRAIKIQPSLLAIVCVAVLCTILTLGLWPFHAPANQVSWLDHRNGLRFGRYGTVFSAGSFLIALPQKQPGASLEIWLQPRRIWDSATFLAFYTPENLFQFSLYQSQTGLLLRTAGAPHRSVASLYVGDVFRKPQPVFITICSAERGVWIYVNGAPAAANPRFPLSAQAFGGRLVLGDSPGQNDSWSGLLRGLAIYQRPLTAPEVALNYAAWKQNGRPEINRNSRNVALYLFDERAGNMVHDKAGSGIDLWIPPKYQVAQKIFLEPFWNEFSFSRDYWSAALKNVVGFIPLGFVFYVFLLTRIPRRALLVTVAWGTAVSFTIEVLQAFLPTRESGTTDLITNTLGAWMGAVLYRFLAPALARFLPWIFLPSPAAPDLAPLASAPRSDGIRLARFQ